MKHRTRIIFGGTAALVLLTSLGVYAREARRTGTSLSLISEAVTPALVASPTPQSAPAESCPQAPNGQAVPQTAQPASPEHPRVWKRYRSDRLGFSVEYPADSFVPLDGMPEGEPDAITFYNKDSTPEKLAHEIGSGFTVEVDLTSGPTAMPLINYGSYPCNQTTLADLPATIFETSDSAQLFLVFKGYQYSIDVSNDSVSGADYLSTADIEHIRESFRLN